MVENFKNKLIRILNNPNELNKNDLKIIKNISHETVGYKIYGPNQY